MSKKASTKCEKSKETDQSLVPLNQIKETQDIIPDKQQLLIDRIKEDSEGDVELLISYLIPDGAVCENINAGGSREGEKCGKPAKACINGIFVCGSHISNIIRPDRIRKPARESDFGRIIQYGQPHVCDNCFGFKSQACPIGKAGMVCLYESGKFTSQDVTIENRDDLVEILTGFLNDNGLRLKRAKLNEQFEGGILDKSIDDLQKNCVNLATQIAKLKGIVASEKNTPKPTQNILEVIFANGVPSVSTPITVEAKEIKK